MRKKLLRLAETVRSEDSSFYNKILKIAKKIQTQEKYLLIDVKEMESMIDPDKVEEYKGIGRIDLDI